MVVVIIINVAILLLLWIIMILVIITSLILSSWLLFHQQLWNGPPNEGHVQNRLVVSTPLKNSQLGWLFPIYGKTCSKPPTRKVIRDHLRKLKGFRLQTDDDLTSEPPAVVKWLRHWGNKNITHTHTLNMISQYDHAIKWQRNINISSHHM